MSQFAKTSSCSNTHSDESSWLTDGNSEICLVSPLAVVVWASPLGLACQAPSVLLLDHTAPVVECDTCVLLRAWIVGHGRHAFLVLHNCGVRATSARVLLNLCQFFLLNRCK